jgi:Flp pilus assembly protein CpaB
MNALKHMEAVFVIALSVAGVGSYLAATSQDANAAPAPVQASVHSAPQMPVVTVVAKRLTAAEKAQSLREETAAAATAIASR